MPGSVRVLGGGSFRVEGPLLRGSGWHELLSGEPGGAALVVDQVGHADLYPRANDADGPHDEGHRSFLTGEDVLDR